MRYLSINEVERLIKQGLYFLETGSHPADSLIYDKKTRQYVGHIENKNRFQQDSHYVVPEYIVEYLDTFDGKSWNKNKKW